MNFNTIGIICEYNPFHFGHKYHIEETKKITKCENIICVMSGSVVQRGECAIFDKWSRAKDAVDAGADLVIELPSYYVLQSADIFAEGAIKLLDSLKITDAISFGCECDDIAAIKNIASIMSDKRYDDKLKELLKTGIGYPRASEQALEYINPTLSEVLKKPNNTLAVSYIKAINSINSKIEAICIKRANDYHSDKTYDGYMSASHIRAMIKSGSDYSMYANDYSLDNIYDMKNAESFILGYLRIIQTDEMKKIKGYEEGLCNLIKSAAGKASSIEELYRLCTSKRYTLHRIKRYIMCTILGINYNCDEPSYVRVLAMGRNGRKILREIKEKSELPIIVKTADYKENSRLFETDLASTDFVALCSKNPSYNHTGKDYTESPYIKKVSP